MKSIPKPWRKKSSVKKNKDEVSAEPSTTRVTDDTLEQHRQEVFSRGRRFLYPIYATKHHIVRKSILVSLGIFVVFLATVSILIYQRKSESTFIYQISKVLPFPAARVDGDFVSYEEYLFVLRSNLTYLKGGSQSETELDAGAQKGLREEALKEAKQNAVLKQLAKDNGVSVSQEEIDQQIELLRSFSGGERRLNDIVNEFYGYSLADLRYPLRVQLLKQKLAPLVSDEARVHAEAIMARVQQGEDFAAVASEASEDEQTAGKGGSLGAVERTNTDVAAELIEAGFSLPVGGISEVVESSQGFHIVKKLSEPSGESAELAHILIRYADINELLNQELTKVSVTDYIKP